MKELIYVYCIAGSHCGLDWNIYLPNLVRLNLGGFQVFVKYVTMDEYSETNLKNNLSDPGWLEKNAREHIQVIGKIMEIGAVIPFRFGTIYYSQEGLEKFITDFSYSLEENLKYIKGKEEWSVKVYCDRKRLCDQIDELSTDAANLEKQIMESSPGKAFLLKRKKIELIENEMDRICKSYGQEYFNLLKSLSENTGLNNLLPKEFTGRNDTMILNATFLVRSGHVEDFKQKVDSIKSGSDNAGFSIELSGPWPPFTFVAIRENRK